MLTTFLACVVTISHACVWSDINGTELYALHGAAGLWSANDDFVLTGCLESHDTEGIIHSHRLNGSLADHDLVLSIEFNQSDSDAFAYRNFTTQINGTAWHGLVVYCISGLCVGTPFGKVALNSLQYYKTGEEDTQRDLMYVVLPPPPPVCSDQFTLDDCKSAECAWCTSADQLHQNCFDKNNVPSSGWDCQQMVV